MPPLATLTATPRRSGLPRPDPRKACSPAWHVRLGTRSTRAAPGAGLCDASGGSRLSRPNAVRCAGRVALVATESCVLRREGRACRDRKLRDAPGGLRLSRPKAARCAGRVALVATESCAGRVALVATESCAMRREGCACRDRKLRDAPGGSRLSRPKAARCAGRVALVATESCAMRREGRACRDRERGPSAMSFRFRSGRSGFLLNTVRKQPIMI